MHGNGTYKTLVGVLLVYGNITVKLGKTLRGVSVRKSANVVVAITVVRVICLNGTLTRCLYRYLIIISRVIYVYDC